MGNRMIEAASAIVAGLIGLAVVALLVSQKAQFPTVLTSAGTALSGVIGAAVSPVTGGNNSFGGSL